MSSYSEFLLWLSVIFPLVFSAGPGNVLCAICGASNGFVKSIPFILGLDLVYVTYSLLAGIGLATIIVNFPKLFFVVQILGALYIGWLGISFLRRKRVQNSESTIELSFFDGVISQALNIKGITIVITMYSQFLNPDRPVYDVLTLSLALMMLNLFAHMSWSYGGSWIAKRFASDYAVRVQSKIFGSMLIAVALWLLYQSIA